MLLVTKLITTKYHKDVLSFGTVGTHALTGMPNIANLDSP